MKIIIDTEKCIGCGSCVGVCPAVFELYVDEKYGMEKSRLKPDCDLTLECVQTAIDVCPVQAISREE